MLSIRSDIGFINLLLNDLIDQILQPWYKYMYTQVAIIPVSKRLKREARQVNQKIFEFRRQDRDPGWLGLGDAVTSVLPLRRHASTSAILSQRYSSIRAVPRAI